MSMAPGHLLYDTEGRLVARVVMSQNGEWMILPEQDFTFVLTVESELLLLWDRKNKRPVEMADIKTEDENELIKD